ncbi:hypothetical protein EX30DRAFT_51230 [Ascodesmis nigricans]|uniref:Telomere-length maintenance and DNA damage repair domain-containing protein n=1 Tax=Ascodesmis nigricans TaxID=341454 RepID=A0A4S2MV72_9PEZI|nr:hypothetical protein EX30DRAFT_51230 [Ascodesmis nigricans]
MSSGDHSLLDLYGKIGSSKLTERANALNDLKHVLSTRRAMSLDAKGWSKMFEVLYKLVNTERSTYLKGNKRKIYAERLAAAGYCLRLAVEAGISKIRSKAFKSLVSHILDTLPNI